MSYTPTPDHIYSPQPQAAPHYYAAPLPAPPPKPGSATPARGPPLPPPPPGAQPQNEPSELDGSQAYHPGQQQQQPHLPQIPTIEPGWLPDILKDKSTADLHALLNDPSLQSALLDNPHTTHPAVPASQSALRPLLDSNIQLSTSLEDLEARLTHQRSAIQSRLLTLRALEQQHRSKLAETENALSSFSPMALYQRLSASVTEQDQLVEGVEASWLEEGGVASDREVTEFVKRVKEAKRTAFLRRERKERWDEGRVGGWR